MHRHAMIWTAAFVPALALATGCDQDKDKADDDFFVVSIVPGDKNTNVNVNSTMVVRFSSAIDPSTYAGNNQIILVDQSNAIVPVSIVPTVAQGASEFVTITPATPLSANTTYGVAVREMVRAVSGGSITAPYAMTFATGATLATIPGWPPFLVPNPAPPNTGPPGTFTLTGQLNTARSRHADVLLQSGDVAIFGGVTPVRSSSAGSTVLRTAEIYKRTAGTWTLAGSNNQFRGMAYPRYGHTATALINGNVLITGGGDERTVWDTAEVYDPRADTFSPTPNFMQNSRQYHTATIIGNGNVLLAGGFSMSIVLTNSAGGSANSAIQIPTIEVYDVPSGTFTLSTQSMRLEKCYHTASLLPGGDVMFAGGYELPWTVNFWCPTTKRCDRYTPDLTSGAGATGTILATGDLKTSRMTHTATSYHSGNAQGLVIVGAGYTTTPFAGLLGTAEVYDHQIPIAGGLKGDWSLIAATMSQPRRAHSASLITTGTDSGKIVYVGGAITAPTLQNIFLPVAPPHLWPSTETHNCGFCAGTITAERFDPFGFGTSLQSPWRGIDVTGQFDWTRNAAGTQTLMVGIPPNPVTPTMGRYYHAATTLPTGHVLIAGGWDCPFCIPPPGAPYWSGPEFALNTCELYNP